HVRRETVWAAARAAGKGNDDRGRPRRATGGDLVPVPTAALPASGRRRVRAGAPRGACALLRRAAAWRREDGGWPGGGPSARPSNAGALPQHRRPGPVAAPVAGL